MSSRMKRGARVLVACASSRRGWMEADVEGCEGTIGFVGGSIFFLAEGSMAQMLYGASFASSSLRFEPKRAPFCPYLQARAKTMRAESPVLLRPKAIIARGPSPCGDQINEACQSRFTLCTRVTWILKVAADQGACNIPSRVVDQGPKLGSTRVAERKEPFDGRSCQCVGLG